MSTYQFGWVRSYRQALERLIQEDVDHHYTDNEYAATEDRVIAAVQLAFVSAMWSLRGPTEVIADMAVLRRETGE